MTVNAAQSFSPPDEKTGSRYQAFFQLAGDAMLVFSIDGHLLEANRRACSCLGLCHDALPEITLAEIMPELDAGAAQIWRGYCSNGEIHTLSTYIQRSDKTGFPAELKVSVRIP